MKAFKKNNFKEINLRNTNKFSNEILSLPINQYLKEKEINFIVSSIKKFFNEKN